MFALLVLGIALLVNATPLDDYVNAPDSSIADLDELRRIESPSLDTLCIPNDVDKKSNSSFLFLDGGDTTDPMPSELDDIVEVLCLKSKTIVAELNQIPDEPIVFVGDGKKRSEDAIIAYTWYKFIQNTSDPTWLLRLPMTKAAVKAMDVIEHYFPNVKQFVVSGGSKRGWTTWTTAAVDKRVFAIVPIVIPILNIVPNLNHHYQAYGGWSFALDDYLDMGIMKYLNAPQFEELAAVVDPFSYIESTGDEFFQPDSPQFFFGQLLGPKYLRMVPNAEHSLEGHHLDVTLSAAQFLRRVLHGEQLPRFSWTMVKSNTSDASITVTAIDPPTSVLMWYANTINETLRDFRLIKCLNLKNPDCIQPVIWWYEELQDQGNGVYVATRPPPGRGWTGFMIELTYQYGSDIEDVLKLTTEVNVVPDIMPFPPCGNNCQ